MENFKPEQPSQEIEVDQILKAQEKLTKLKLPETGAMADLHLQIVLELANKGGQAGTLADHYHELIEDETSQTPDQDLYNRRQLATMLSMASIWLEIGNSQQCLDDLYAATIYAEQIGFEAEYNDIYDIIDILTVDSDNV